MTVGPCTARRPDRHVERGEAVPHPQGGAGARREADHRIPEDVPARRARLQRFPAFPSNPPRLHDQHCSSPAIPAGSSGAIQALTAAGDPIVAPLGPNMLTYNEERFSSCTFQIATQTDGLNHVGVGTTYYNGVQFDDMVADYGTRELGGEHCPPIVTRGVILDIVGLKQDLGETNDLITHNGEAMLSETLPHHAERHRRGHAPRPHQGDPPGRRRPLLHGVDAPRRSGHRRPCEVSRHRARHLPGRDPLPRRQPSRHHRRRLLGAGGRRQRRCDAGQPLPVPPGAPRPARHPHRRGLPHPRAHPRQHLRVRRSW